MTKKLYITIVISLLVLFNIPYSISITQYVNEALQPKIVYADTTNYSATDSCHYKGCLMASGRRAYEGAVACPRSVKLGTYVEIDGKQYRCEDRTAKWVEKKFGDTYDIFVGYAKEDYKNSLEYGRITKQIKILP